MKQKFEMSSMGEMKFFLGLQVDQLPEGIFIHQTKYVHDVLEKFSMSGTAPMSTPLATNHSINPDLTGEKVDETLYRLMIGSLMYLTASRPDIMYPTCLTARYQSSPRASHMVIVKEILPHLKGTPSLGLWYPKDGMKLLSSGGDVIGVDEESKAEDVGKQSTLLKPDGECETRVLNKRKGSDAFQVELVIGTQEVSKTAVHGPFNHYWKVKCGLDGQEL
ncbi:uncharacterized mitochondrial protein AtMg00810-like [Helianthus annuus]|uniref:uncharacterized mitochondrial protein AtMg00810-like n=1 Tax=Helianthus annuus TaxID=4232 RepID=UPI000B8F8A87|nr:uncharacterized mitochondrial protein AtMg00810-like [Helianthus annuus]